MIPLYSVIRSHRDIDGEWEKIECTGMKWEDARAASLRYEERERQAYPRKSSWARDVFYCLLEGCPRHHKLVSEMEVAQ
jgi:hypothetical protein